MAKEQEDKIEKLNASVEYDGDGELMSDISTSEPLTLMSDISTSEPLTFTCNGCGKEYKTKRGYDNHIKNCDAIVETVETETVETETVEEIKVDVKPEPALKDMYEQMVTEDKPFILKLNGVIIFDSDKDNIMKLSFSENHFRIGTEMFPYLGLNFKYKK